MQRNRKTEKKTHNRTEKIVNSNNVRKGHKLRAVVVVVPHVTVEMAFANERRATLLISFFFLIGKKKQTRNKEKKEMPSTMQKF